MKTTSYVFALAAFASVLFLSSCSNNDPAPVTLTSVTFKNLAADPPSGGYNQTNGQPKFTFFSFKTGAIVANADSASTKWDIGFNATTIIVNGGKSGPGKGQAQVYTGAYSDLLEAPESGYLSDNDTAPIGDAPNSSLAIQTGSNKGWYTYNGATRTVSPTAGKFLVFKTADERYAKMEIISYYKDAPETVSSAIADRYYTFRYVYQGDGTKNFK
jgi:hypothetical protein